MTRNERHRVLASLGWRQDDKKLQHRILGEIYHWYSGDIDGTEWSAWIGSETGKCCPHGAEDFSFDEFTKIIASGWPGKKVLAGSRSLFDDEGE